MLFLTALFFPQMAPKASVATIIINKRKPADGDAQPLVQPAKKRKSEKEKEVEAKEKEKEVEAKEKEKELEAKEKELVSETRDLVLKLKANLCQLSDGIGNHKHLEVRRAREKTYWTHSWNCNRTSRALSKRLEKECFIS